MKTLRAAVVSRSLGLKFDRSTTETTSVRGWTDTYPGYKCQQDGDYAVRVRWEFGDNYAGRMIGLKERERISLERCQEMQVYLTGVGNGNTFNPQLYQTSSYLGCSESYLVVTAKVPE